MNQLDRHDLIILSKYWKEYSTMNKQLDKATTKVKKDRLTSIMQAIETVFNECTGDMKDVINLTLWDIYDDKAAAEELSVKPTHVKRLKKNVLLRTAEELGWV